MGFLGVKECVPSFKAPGNFISRTSRKLYRSVPDIMGVFEKCMQRNIVLVFRPLVSQRTTSCQGQQSAQGILRLRNPNLGPNSVKRILDARILNPNSWVEFFDSVFSSKRGPLKNSRSRNSPPKIHLPKFNPEMGPKNSHCTSAGPFG